MTRQAALLCVILAACGSEGPKAATDAGAGDAADLSGLFGGGRGGAGVLGLADAAAEPIDAAPADLDARAVLDAADIGDANVPTAPGDAQVLDGGTDPMFGVVDGGHALEFRPGAGCVAGYLNCDGVVANGCEMIVGCPGSGKMACESGCLYRDGDAGTVSSTYVCVCSASSGAFFACAPNRCP